jgi:hypothetical protein
MREIIRWALGTWPSRTVSVVVHPANLHDRIGATLVLGRSGPRFHPLGSAAFWDYLPEMICWRTEEFRVR